MSIPILPKKMIFTAMILGLAVVTAAAGVQPMAALREAVDQGLAILNDRTADARQEARMRQASLALFDFPAMARLVLAARWYEFTPEEKATFETAFTQFLLQTYVPLLIDRYRGEQIEYVRQVRISDVKARVDVRVWQDGKAIPVTVKMMRRRGLWKIYDLDALGFSAVANYRAQFQWLLRRETPAQVIERLENMHGPAVP